MLELDLERAFAEPFPGLRAFEPHESFLFYGRSTHTEELLDRLSSNRFLAVVGTSGSGKSSLVRAGLLPALYRGHLAGAGSRWRIALMRPGNAPLDRLAEAVASEEVLEGSNAPEILESISRSSLGLVETVRSRIPSDDSLLVVVDQFEELFRFQQRIDDDGAQAALFVRSLIEASDQLGTPIYVILTMRSDFLGDCAKFPGLPEALNDCQYLIPRLTRAQRREAIEGPLRVARSSIAPLLVQRLLNDGGDEPDQLPVLQHALMRTFHEASGSPLELEHYERVGAMAKALDLHAEAIYETLHSDGQRRMVERLFRGLTTLQQGRATRRPATLRHLGAITGASSPEKQRILGEVVGAYADKECSFLLVSQSSGRGPEAMIDISHESLIRKWQRLNRWVADEARSAAYYHDVSRDAALHDEGKAGLWRDPKLSEAMAFRNSGEWNEAWAAQYERSGDSSFPRSVAFLEASRNALQEERRREAARRSKEKRMLGGLAAALLLFIVVLIALGITYLGQQRAEREVAVAYEQLASLELQATEAQQRADEAAKTAEELRAIASGLESAGGQSADEIDQLKEQIARLESESAKYSDDAQTARLRASAVQQKAAAAPMAVADPSSEVRKLQSELELSRAENRSLRNELANGQARIDELEANRADPNLPGATGLVWEAWSQGQGALPSGSFPGGEDATGPLHICRATYLGGKHPGYIASGQCHFGWGGKEIVMPNYEVLIGDPAFHWVTSRGGPLPQGAVIGGEEPERVLHICRGRWQGGLRPGKLVEGQCNIPSGGDEVLLDDYELLVRR